jgi:hypothetical protein
MFTLRLLNKTEGQNALFFLNEVCQVQTKVIALFVIMEDFEE